MEPLTDAQQALVEQHQGIALAFAATKASHYAVSIGNKGGHNAVLDEVEEIAFDGLLLAAHKWEEERNVPFPVWATMQMNWSLRHAISKKLKNREYNTENPNDIDWMDSSHDFASDALINAEVEWLANNMSGDSGKLLMDLFAGYQRKDIIEKDEISTSTAVGRVHSMRRKALKLLKEGNKISNVKLKNDEIGGEYELMLVDVRKLMEDLQDVISWQEGEKLKKLKDKLDQALSDDWSLFYARNIIFSKKKQIEPEQLTLSVKEIDGIPCLLLPESGD